MTMLEKLGFKGLLKVTESKDYFKVYVFESNKTYLVNKLTEKVFEL